MKKHPNKRANGNAAAPAHPAPNPATPPSLAEISARLAALEQAEREQAEPTGGATGPAANPATGEARPVEQAAPDGLPELPAQGWILSDSFESYDETPDGDAIADAGFGAARDFIPWKRAVLRFPLYYRATGLFYKGGKPFVWYEFTPEPFAALRGHCSPDSFLLARPLESLESEPRPVSA